MKQRLTYSELRQQPRINLREAVPLSMPLSMYLDPSSTCNYRCVFCPQSGANRDGFSDKMDFNSFQKIAREIKALGKLKTCNLFSFGEPLLNPLTPKFLKTAVELDIAEKYVITTNASLLNKERVRELVDYGLSFLRVSIYGADTPSYRKRTGTNIDLEHIQSNLSYLLDYRNKVGGALSIAVKMLDSGDPDENKAFIEKFSGLADECFIEPLHNWHDNEEKYAKVTPSTQRQVCPYPFYTLVVHADLSVSVCCPDWNKMVTVGNLKTQSLSEIWHGQEIFAIQNALLSGEYSGLPVCAGCNFYQISAGDSLDGLTAELYKSRCEQGLTLQPRKAK